VQWRTNKSKPTFKTIGQSYWLSQKSMLMVASTCRIPLLRHRPKSKMALSFWSSFTGIPTLRVLGLDDLELKKGMVENLFFMFEQYGYIPNSSNLSQHWGRSQPPVLTLLIRQIYDESKDLEWLERAYKVATDEYKYVWMSKRHPHSRLVYSGLSRYYHADQTHRGAEDESGWDYTTRFDGRALDWLPVDLNCLLYTSMRSICFSLPQCWVAQKKLTNGRARL
jgi:neutral trehalase